MASSGVTTETQGSTKSVILTYDCQIVLVCHPVREGLTVNAAYYSSFLMYQLRRAVCTKHPELLDNTIILHDNATAHTAATVQRRLQRWRWEVPPHPPYSPDLSPCDYDLIPEVKKPLRGKRFANKKRHPNSISERGVTR